MLRASVSCARSVMEKYTKIKLNNEEGVINNTSSF